MVQLNKNKSNMIDCMGEYYLNQMVFLVFYIKEHICDKKMSLKVDFNINGREGKGDIFDDILLHLDVNRDGEG